MQSFGEEEGAQILSFREEEGAQVQIVAFSYSNILKRILYCQTQKRNGSIH